MIDWGALEIAGSILVVAIVIFYMWRRREAPKPGQ